MCTPTHTQHKFQKEPSSEISSKVRGWPTRCIPKTHSQTPLWAHNVRGNWGSLAYRTWTTRITQCSGRETEVESEEKMGSRWFSHLVDRGKKAREMKRRGRVHWREREGGSWRDVWGRGGGWEYPCVSEWSTSVCVVFASDCLCSKVVQPRLRCQRTVRLSRSVEYTYVTHTHTYTQTHGW